MDLIKNHLSFQAGQFLIENTQTWPTGPKISESSILVKLASFQSELWNGSHVKWVEEVCNPFDGPGYQLNVLPSIKVWSL